MIALQRGRVDLTWVVIIIFVMTIFPVGARFDPNGWSRSFVTLQLNTQDRGEAIALLNGTDVALSEETCLKLSFSCRKAPDVFYHNQQYYLVSASAIGQKMKVDFDEKKLVLNVILPPESFPHQYKHIIAAQTNEITDDNVKHASRTTILNYQLTQGTYASGYFDASTTIGKVLAETRLTATPHKLIRGETNGIIDDEQHDRQMIIGDSTVLSDDAIGGNPSIGGFQVRRTTQYHPDIIRYPTPTLQGRVEGPATADVYVNSQLVSQVQLAPGAYDLSAVPVPGGGANATVVIHDALGHTLTTSEMYYSNPTMLGQGLSDYVYAAGQSNTGAFGPGYTDMLEYMKYRVGLTNHLTVGMRFEHAPGLTSLGPTIDTGSKLGALHVGLGESLYHAARGSALTASYTYSNNNATLNSSYVIMSPDYATTSFLPDPSHTKRMLSLNSSLRLSRQTTLLTGYSLTQQQDDEYHRNLTVGLNRSTQSTANYSFNATVSRGTHQAGTTWGMSAQVTLMLGANDRASESINTLQSDAHLSTSISHSRPYPTGLAYSSTFDAGQTRDYSFQGDYRTGFTDIGASTYVPPTGRSTYSGTLSGGIVEVGGHTYFTPQAGNGFALIQVPGLAYTPVYLENREVTRTDGHGNALVSNLTPYVSNRISIQPPDSLLDLEVEKNHVHVRTAYDRAEIVRFEALPIVAFVGKIRLSRHGQVEVPKWGEANVMNENTTLTSPLGLNGEYYFERLSPGKHQVTVSWHDDEYRCVLDVPLTKAMRTDLGLLPCV